MKPVSTFAGAFALALIATSSFADGTAPIVPESVTWTTYNAKRDANGNVNDLLSAGLNLAGLMGPAPFVHPTNPTIEELRRRAIYNNYRGIVDPVAGGGMGLLWGPQSPGTPSFPGVEFGLIPGTEYKGYLRVSDGRGHVNNVPAAVQIPDNFNPEQPCIVGAMPSGSRSLYGGIGIAEWALFKGCAVALPGKGTDTGFQLLGAESAAYAVTGLDGLAGPVDALADDAQFALRPSRALDAYIKANPHRVATKHAHSQINPEGQWGRFALGGIEFAFWALNHHFETQGAKRFDRQNTLVIAAGASNGGGMALRALEEDGEGLIDGLVVTEPNIGPQDGRVAIKFGNDPLFYPEGRSLYDSISLMSVYAACASLATGPLATPILGPNPLAPNRCASLAEKGLVTGASTPEQAASALERLRAHGYARAQDWGIASHDGPALNLWRALQPTYANAYGRFAVEENVCGVSFAATGVDFKPAPMTETNARKIFADSNGVPPTGGINLIADWSRDGAILENIAVSRSTNRQDINLDSALCFRALETGEGLASGADSARHARLKAGTRQIETTGRIHGKPAIVIHGRRDALIFPNLHSRAYYALNQENEGASSGLRYIEVTTGQHFDAFISNFLVGPSGVQFAPLHYYFVLAMDSMYAHLTSAAVLPPSQVVRPQPRGFQPYTAANVPALLPALSNAPAAGDRITFSDGVLTIPE